VRGGGGDEVRGGEERSLFGCPQEPQKCRCDVTDDPPFSFFCHAAGVCAHTHAPLKLSSEPTVASESTLAASRPLRVTTRRQNGCPLPAICVTPPDCPHCTAFSSEPSVSVGRLRAPPLTFLASNNPRLRRRNKSRPGPGSLPSSRRHSATSPASSYTTTVTPVAAPIHNMVVLETEGVDGVETGEEGADQGGWQLGLQQPAFPPNALYTEPPPPPPSSLFEWFHSITSDTALSIATPPSPSLSPNASFGSALDASATRNEDEVALMSCGRNSSKSEEENGNTNDGDAGAAAIPISFAFPSPLPCGIQSTFLASPAPTPAAAGEWGADRAWSPNLSCPA